MPKKDSALSQLNKIRFKAFYENKEITIKDLKREILDDLKMFGIRTKVLILSHTQNNALWWRKNLFLKVIFNSEEDMNLYRLIGNYKENEYVRFFVK